MSIDSEELGNLGEGWEIRYTAHGRQYFVDHINRTTQFTGVCACVCVCVECVCTYGSIVYVHCVCVQSLIRFVCNWGIV